MQNKESEIGHLETLADGKWLPLTSLQGSIWADEQLNPGIGRNLLILKINMDRPTDTAQFREAWIATLKAHDAFRLAVDAAESRQKIGPFTPVIREASLPDAGSIDSFFHRLPHIDVDPRHPLWDLSLLTLDSGEYACIFRAHRLICDEVSIKLLVSEVSARYLSTKLHGPQGGSFEDFLVSEAKKDIRAGNGTDIEAWRALLTSPPPVASLLGCSHGTMNEGRVCVAIQLPEQSRETLIRVASEREKELEKAVNTILAAAAFAWIYRLSGQRDIILSVPEHSRESKALKMIGPLGNRLLLRLSVDEGETPASLVAKVEAAYRFGEGHPRSCPASGGLATAFVGERFIWSGEFCGSAAHFALEELNDYDRSYPDDRLEGIRLRHTGAEAPEGIVLDFDFDAGVYPESVRDRLTVYFLRILDTLLTDDGVNIDDINLLDPQELSILEERGRGPRLESVPDLLETLARHVREHPDKSAVEFNGEVMTYAELDRTTNRLARRLRALGVTKGARVAVAMPRGFGEYCSLTAVLKTDGAYVPIDLSHPIERISIVLEDAQPQVLIAPVDSPLISALPPGTPHLALGDPRTEGQDTNDNPLEISNDPEQLAYILFTSGSTGRPKGVEIPRGALANFLSSATKIIGIKPTDRQAAISTTTFDMSELDFYLPIWAGATVVIADKDTALDPIRLRTLLELTDVSVMQAPPTTWRLLLDAGWTGSPSFRALTGGEAISLALAQRLLDCAAELWNLYGPTETTVYSTICQIPRGVDRITIGTPIYNTIISLRDPAGRIVPMGTIGEICIAGRGLALGYRSRPDLTAERFIIDPKTGERYYRTGDLGRYLPDRRLECLGRVDHQVKVRGFRVEPMDIEAQLRMVPGVTEVLVVALVRGDGDPQLVAYWVGGASRDALHDRAKSTLPRYMVPSAYVRLDEFPLTTTGKIDRKKLPPPDASQDVEEGAILPRNDQEAIVAAAWREVLGLSTVPVDKDFFSLGGTSLRVVQLRTLIKKAFGTELPLRALFDHPTVEGIVSRLGKAPEADAPVVSWLSKDNDRLPWIGIMGIQLFEDMAKELHGSGPLLAMHVPVRYNPDTEPFPSIQRVAKAYVDEIRRLQPTGPYFLLGLCYGGIVAFEAAAQLEEEGERVAIVALLDAELPKARRTRIRIRIGYLLRRLIKDPLGFFRKLSGRLSKAEGHRSSRCPLDTNRGLMEMPVDGPDVDEEIARYQALNRGIQGWAIAFRATERDSAAPWIEVTEDLGWVDRAEKFSFHDIPSSHLGIVRGSHAAQVARHLAEARRSVENTEG